MNNNYYQSDIRTSRQEDILLSIDDDRQCLLGLIKYWREECFKQDKQLKAYENMRKEAINLIEKETYFSSNDDDVAFFYKILSLADDELDNLLNILNKVGSDK